MDYAKEFSSDLSRLKDLSLKKGLALIYNGGHGAINSLPEPERIKITAALKKYADILCGPETEPDFEKYDIRNSKQMTIKALGHLKLKVPDEVLNNIKEDDYVELYLADGTPVFKTPNFWGTSSYNLDQIYTRPYSELYGRDEFSELKIQKGIIEVSSGKKAMIVDPVQEHDAFERLGPVKARTKYKYFASAIDSESDAIIGLIAVSEVKLLSSLPS